MSSPAVETIQHSKIDPAAQTRGLMGDDLNLQAIKLYISGKLKLKLDDQITDVVVNRVIEGASTITISLNDDDRAVLRSGLLTSGGTDPLSQNWLDMQIDGLWWRLVQVRKDDGDNLDLIFEQREIAILRLYDSVLLMTGLTRAEFILYLIRELAPTIQIPVVIPELHTVQPQVTTASTKTVAQLQNPQVSSDLPYVTPSPLPGNDTKTQYANAIAAATGLDPRVVLAWMASEGDPGDLPGYFNYMNITSDTARSLGIPIVGTGPAGTAIFGNIQDGIAAAIKEIQSLGISSRGTPADQIASIAASRWASSHYDKPFNNPGAGGPDLVRVFVDMFGENALHSTSPVFPVPGIPTPGTTIPTNLPSDSIVGGRRLITPQIGSDFTFYRGIPQDGNKDWGLENSWDCIQRLAQEVNWYAFFVGGVFWYVDGPTLLATKAIMIIDESSRGVASIAFDYDRGKKSAEVTLTCRIGRWLAPPGAVVVLNHMGPVNGRWIVTEFQRSLMDLTATITLKKPMPELPEPPTPTNLPPDPTGVPGGTKTPPTTLPGISGKPGTWNYPRMCQAGKVTAIPGYSNLQALPQADPYHVDLRILDALDTCAKSFGVTVTIISGYRDPAYSQKVGGYSTDPHTRGVAADAEIGNKLIGDYGGGIFADCLRSKGMEVGDTPGFYNGQRDPEHVQIPGSGVDKSIVAGQWLGCP